MDINSLKGSRIDTIKQLALQQRKSTSTSGLFVNAQGISRLAKTNTTSSRILSSRRDKSPRLASFLRPSSAVLPKQPQNGLSFRDATNRPSTSSRPSRVYEYQKRVTHTASGNIVYDKRSMRKRMTPTLNEAPEKKKEAEPSEQETHRHFPQLGTLSDDATIPQQKRPSVIPPIEPQKKDDEVVIHVFDETNGVKRDFTCKRDLLLKEMKYFRSYITDSCTFEDIDISVHCDINIFQWLMDYIKKEGPEPQLDVTWAISILISSDFLEMDELVEKTLKFVKENLQSIIKLPIELECINSKLLSRLSNLFTGK